MARITILTVTCNRIEKLNNYLISVVNAERFNEIEVLILLNGECFSSEKILNRYCHNYRNVNFIKSSKQSRGSARHVLLKSAQGEAVYFLDDDIIVEKTTFLILLKAFEKFAHIDIFGGPNLTSLNSTLFQIAQGSVLKAFFGTLWMRKRYSSLGKPMIADEQSLILCNLAFRKRLFSESNIYFNQRIVCAEENLLLQELKAEGYKAMYLPELVVYHERRTNYAEFCDQIFTYGRGRCQVAKCRLRINNMLYCIPSIFVVYLVLLCFANQIVCFFPFFIYLFLSIFNSMKGALKVKNFLLFWILLLLFPTTHAAYGLGYLFELFRVNFSKVSLGVKTE